MNRRVRWKSEPDDHDYPAARDYLALVLPTEIVDRLVSALRATETTCHKSKDLLRASGLAPLGSDNPHVARDLHKISAGEELSPVLLVRGDARRNRALIVADGFHRVCAVHSLDENADIPCKLIDLADGGHDQSNRSIQSGGG